LVDVGSPRAPARERGGVCFAAPVAGLGSGPRPPYGWAHFFFSIPEIVFELSITIYTIVKGFRPSPILDDARYAVT
jgi:hypothetical protein